MSRPRVAVVGSINLDYSMRVPTLPSAGETLAGDDFDLSLGGKGANQAVAAARLGAETALIGSVGDDAAADRALHAFAEDGLDTSCVVRQAASHTGSALIFVDAAGENCIGVSPGANGLLRPAHVDRAAPLLRGAGSLLLQLETPVDTVLHAAGIAREAGCRIILNPAPLRAELPAALFAAVDVLTPNAHEAARLTGRSIDNLETAASAAQALRERGPALVVITLGADGALAVSDAGTVHVPAPRVEAIDTVGAGDTFNGGLACALAAGRGLDAALRFAVAAAAISVTRRGAQSSIPRLGEVDSAA